MATAAVPYVFVLGTKIKSAESNANFQAVIDFLNGSVSHLDGSKAFTGIPVLPATTPTSDNQATRKAYVDTVVGTVQTNLTAEIAARTAADVTVQIAGQVDAQARANAAQASARADHTAGSIGVTSNGAGLFSVNFPRTLSGVPGVTISPFQPSGIVYAVASTSTTGFTAYMIGSGTGTVLPSRSENIMYVAVVP